MEIVIIMASSRLCLCPYCSTNPRAANLGPSLSSRAEQPDFLFRAAVGRVGSRSRGISLWWEPRRGEIPHSADSVRNDGRSETKMSVRRQLYSTGALTWMTKTKELVVGAFNLETPTPYVLRKCGNNWTYGQPARMCGNDWT